MTRRNVLSFFVSFLAFSQSQILANTPKIGIKIGFLPINDHLIIIAKELFKSENFTLVPVKFSNWADLSEALRAGAIEGAFLLAPLGLKLRANGVKIKAVMPAHKNGSALVVRNEISKINDLNGKKIAIPSRFSTHFYLLDKLLQKHEISANLIDMVPTEMPFALASSQIDAYIVAEPFGQISVDKNFAKNLIFSKEIEPNHICCVLNFHEKILALSEFNEILQSFKNAANFISQNKAESAILGEKILGQKAKILKSVLEKNITTFDDLSLNLAEFENLKDFLIRKNLADENLKNLNISEYLA